VSVNVAAAIARVYGQKSDVGLRSVIAACSRA
jgi:hypothetical protein